MKSSNLLLASLLCLLLTYTALAELPPWEGNNIYEFGDGESIVEATLNDTATLNMTGGEISAGLTCYNSSTLNMTGGYIGYLGPRDFSTIFLYGGMIDLMGARDFSQITLYVSEYTRLPGAEDGILTGIWGNGIDAFSIQLYDGTWDHIDIKIVPEPATLALFSFGCLLLRKKR